MNQQLFKKLLCIQSNHCEESGRFPGSRHMLPPNQHIWLLTNINGTQLKEDSGKSIKRALCALQYAKRQFSG